MLTEVKYIENLRGLCWSNKVKLYETVFYDKICLYFYVVPLRGDLLSKTRYRSKICPHKNPEHITCV